MNDEEIKEKDIPVESFYDDVCGGSDWLDLLCVVSPILVLFVYAVLF